MRRGLLATRDELHALRDRITTRPFNRIYDRLLKRCSLVLESGPVSETQWQHLWSAGHWSSAVTAAQTTQGRIIDLVIAHHIEANAAYRDRAIEELRTLSRWTTWVDPCHSRVSADLCTAEASVAVALGLDWLWEDLSEEDRAHMLAALRSKGIEPYRKAVEEKAWWYACYHNWNAVVNGGCAFAGLALGDEDPTAQEVYDLGRKGMKSFFDALGREGGWDEGTGYWGFALRYVLLLGEAASRLMDDQRIFHERGMDVTGLFPIYFTPNGHAASFGDVARVPAFGAMYSLVKRYGLEELTWWLDTYTFSHDVSSTGWSEAGLALLLRPADAASPKTVDLEPVKVFDQVGWAALADTWPRPGFYVAAKTGDLSSNHSQRDMNSIQLQVDGEMILTDLGNPPYCREYFSESREEFYEVQARGHNTIVVAERDHQIDAQGRVVESGLGDNYRWVACDSQHACGESVQFIRHIVMLLDPSGAGSDLVVLDELTNGVPERMALYWHTRGLIELEEGDSWGSIVGRRATVHFVLASTAKFAVETQTHTPGGNGVDNVLRLSAGVIDKVFFASAFSREKPDRLEIKQGRTGGLSVRLGENALNFKSERNHLLLDGVERA